MLERLRESRPVHRIEVAAHDHGLDQLVLTDAVEQWLLRTARVVTAFVLAGFGLALLELGTPASPYVTWEETASLIAFGLAALGLAVAWWWQPAASLTLVAGVFVGALAAYQYSPLIALGVTLLFMVPAALFLLAWQRTQTWMAIITLALVSLLLLGVGAAVATTVYRQGQGAAHPGSPLEALPPSATAWMWSGAVRPTSATVVAKAPGAGEVRLAYAPNGELSDPKFVAGEGRGPEYRFHLVGLEPSTTYTYAVEVDGTIDDIRRGTLTTFAAGPMDFSIAFGCSSRTRSNGAVFDTIRDLAPALYLSTGDFHYGDVIEDSLSAFGEFYDLTLTRPAQGALYRSVPIAYMWDDHDFGPNDAAADSPSRQAALVSYRTHVPHYPLVMEGMASPIGQAFTIGRVRFILTDLRSDRDPKSSPDGPEKSMLGEDQLPWFLDELTRSMEEYPLVVWVSSVPWIAEPEPGADHWGGYSHERERIAAAIAGTGRDNLIMLAGDAHMVAIDDGTNSDYAPGGGAGFPVIQAGALDRVGSFKGGPYSEGAHPGGGQFGYLTVEDVGSEMRVRLAGLTWELEELVSLELAFPAG